MEILYVPAGGTGRFQINDTHLHKPLKAFAQQIAGQWYAKNVIRLKKLRDDTGMSNEDYQARLNTLMRIGTLRNMAPIWLDQAVKYISKPLEGEGRNLIQKGWDELYLGPINVDGFLQEALQAQETASRQREADKEKAVQMAAVHWFGEHGNLDAFDRSKVEVQDFNVSVEARAVSEAECTYHEM